jgi:hypothetical protein
MPPWNIGVLLLIALGVLAIPYRLRKKELGCLKGRVSIGIEELYERYYANSGLSKASVSEIWNEIATTLRVPPEKLRPTDRFGEDIGLYFGPSDRLDTLSQLASKRARRRQLNVRLAAFRTVDDYVRALADPA